MRLGLSRVERSAADGARIADERDREEGLSSRLVSLSIAIERL
jgi:hypothetical protein